ncbi:beta-lactamase family protein [Actinosynnema pretiosum subsp. pretiosum]|uniref:Beta-lactamase family protein n=1 Tax=Actinosynnema pretiosum subsp. pretiosum TaxID=103721 RepID=A0AA45R3J9_9PSEU|nr:D-alanyl-D-alanine carboxypeptidase [Actinosynnema pretiosum subsp. pretiosum]QUF03916.1 beta-lactamase family protein [Actinosynnema pretiosum subsp. pretiosum]
MSNKPIERGNPLSRNRLLLGALVATTALAAGAAPVALADQEARESDRAVRQGLERLVTAHGFPSAMASVRERDGRTRFLAPRAGERVPVDGQVRIGSAGKMFVSAVVMQLVAEGKVDLDAPVETYLPGLVRGEGFDGREIAVHQLLQHTSGIPEYTDVVADDVLAIRHTHYEPHELLDVALARPRTVPQNEKTYYSNTNYVLAGLLVQRVTGRPLGEEITRRVIEPLGLRETYWPGVGEERIREAHPRGYVVKDGTRTDISDLDPSWAWSAGNLVASPSDLNKFLAALVGGRLVAPEQLARMQRTVEADRFPSTWHYGLGLMKIDLSCGGHAWGHGGDIDGYETRDAVTEDGRAATVVVTALPDSNEQVEAVNEVLDTALCAR